MRACCIDGCPRAAIDGSGQCDKHQVFVPRARVKQEREKPIRQRVYDALVAAGCMVKVHTIDNRLNQATGLGVGTSDLICIVPPRGVFLAIEMKRPKYSPSDVTPKQRAFLVAVRHFGGVSGIATCEAEALALVAEARQPRSSNAPLDP